MRLPADATLIVIESEDPWNGTQDTGAPEANVAALVAAWRAERLPRVRVRRSRFDLVAPGAGPAPDGEIVLDNAANSAFSDARLEVTLDDIGATTLVFCGLPESAVAATAREACALGYQVFVPADAIGHDGKDARDGQAFARLARDGANIVDTLTTLGAAAMAKARQRWREERSREV